MYSRRKVRRPMAEINIVPYIDVMLVLLVIFMITTPLLNQGVDVNLPQAKSRPLKVAEAQPIVVSVDARGQFFLNISSTPKSPIRAVDLVSMVQEALADSKQKGQQQAVLVKGDETANYGTIVQAMVLLQRAGVNDVGLMTRTPSN
ncbi:MAG: protein TolR [Gammaproteobacteria bacterium]|nr:protein TolR [Gammaproteobacteria bacterium]